MSDADHYLECGYAREEALKEVKNLPEWKVKLLAAMALTHHDSVFSDRQTDLDRGIHELMNRKPYWWTV